MAPEMAKTSSRREQFTL